MAISDYLKKIELHKSIPYFMQKKYFANHIKSIVFQIEFMLQEKPQLKDSKDWKELYASLRRKFGLREEFTEMVMLCRKCCALFWKSLGHPCFVMEDDAEDLENNYSALQQPTSGNESAVVTSGDQLIPVSPKSFLTFFSV